MEHFSPFESGVAVTIGTFDGIHLGHQALLHRLIEVGRERQLPTIAVTFDRHPLEVVAPSKAPLLLNSCRDRAEGLARIGVNRVLVLGFDDVIAEIGAREFVTSILMEKVGMRFAVVGQNFRFGRKRHGDHHLLAEMGRELGFGVEVVPPVLMDGQPISSTLIRRTVEGGEVRKAAAMLGGFYAVKGVVERGDGCGRELGFPTANIRTGERQLLPKDGVYAVNVRFHNVALRGAANVGTRPTVGGGPRLLEVHLIGYEGDLYGQELDIQFLQRIRDEKKFASLDELVAQIRHDVHQALGASGCLQCDADREPAVTIPAG